MNWAAMTLRLLGMRFVKEWRNKWRPKQGGVSTILITLMNMSGSRA